MKTLIIIFSLLLGSVCFSQPIWTKYTFTSGYVDKNPAFSYKYYTSSNLFAWEYLIFERWSGGNSQICVLKIGQEGPIDTVKKLTVSSTQKRNPSISYVAYNSYLNPKVPYALAIWEEFTSGRWNLFASSFDTLSGWSSPYAFDTTNFNKSGVKITGSSTPVFNIVFERNNDIIYRQFNSQTRQISYDTNFTLADTAICGNPITAIQSSGITVLAYEKKKSDNKKAIYYSFKTGTGTWSLPDTAAYLGNNAICEIGCNGFLIPEVIFQSDRSGKNKLYSTQIYPQSQVSQSLLFNFQNNISHYTALRTFLYPILTDYPIMQAITYIRKTDSTKLFCGLSSVTDSTTIGDTAVTLKPSINRGIILGYQARIWVVYTKDSLSYSNIYAKKNFVVINNINKLSNTVPEKFELSQNYPNPFNPSTNIRYDIPVCHSGEGRNLVKLTVFDALGREVETLVNEKQSAGSYEVTFNASQYPSGIYFYRLTTDNFSETKKIVLLK